MSEHGTYYPKMGPGMLEFGSVTCCQIVKHRCSVYGSVAAKFGAEWIVVVFNVHQ